MRKVLRKSLTMLLAFAMVLTMIPASVFATTIAADGVDHEWYNFRNNQENNGVTERPTPIDVNETWMRFGVKYGTGWSAAPTPPLILDGCLYIARNKQVLKLDKETGDLLAASDEMAGTVGFAMNPILYADGKLFVQVGNGIIQALDYKTLKCVWHTEKISGQTVSPIAYTKGKDGKGYIYTGTWKSESGDGTFFCVSTDDKNVVDGVKQHSWKFIPKEDDEILKNDADSKKRGFYWAGAYANENYVAIGSDDGTKEGDYSANAVFYTLNTTTGEIIDRIDHIKGDIRSSIVYDNGYLYFNTKGGLLYKVSVNADGTFNHDNVQSIDLGGMTTATPLVYKNKIYLGVAGKGGQFDPDGGHRFAVIDNEGPLKELYSLPIKGYPQAGALLSTAHENDDYDGDGNPDGRVYLYFTYNAPPGGIYYTYDTPNGTEASKSQGEIFVPNKEDQEHCISTIIADREGTLYYKNDSCKIFAVEINPAYLTGIKLKTNGKEAKLSPAVIPQIRDYNTVVSPTDKATIELQLPEGVKAEIDGKPYTGKEMEVNLPENVTKIRIKTSKEGKSRDYSVSVKKQLEDAYLGELFVNNTNNSSGGNIVQVSPVLNQNDVNYTADMTDISEKSFYNIWATPSEATSKIEVRALSNFDTAHYKDKENPEKPLIEAIREPRTGKYRYPLYFKDPKKTAEAEIKVTTSTGQTERIYKLTLLKKVDVKSVEIVGGNREIAVGDKIKMEAKILPEDASNKNVKWSVHPADIASIDEKTGELTALAPGEVTVGVTTDDHGITATCKVKVKAVAVEGVEIVGGDRHIKVNNKFNFHALVKPENATNKKVTWEVDNTDLATINPETGEFTALKTGNVEVKVTTEEGKLTDICKVTIDTILVDPEGNWKHNSSGWWYQTGKGEKDYIKNEFAKIGGNTYYFNENGYMTTDWQKISNKWYYFDGNGYMATDWKKISDEWYYFDGNGCMTTGWKKLSDKWYYFDGNGCMTTGWEKLSDKWYYFDGSGCMTTGWKKLSDKWYYFDENGYMTTGWKKISDKWYYFDGNGYMETGWKKMSKKWYYFDGSGCMTTGWKKISNKWYYFDENGYMETGWKKIDGKSYYFYSDGHMAANEKTPDGYYVDGSGVWK